MLDSDGAAPRGKNDLLADPQSADFFVTALDATRPAVSAIFLQVDAELVASREAFDAFGLTRRRHAVKACCTDQSTCSAVLRVAL